MKTKEKTNSKTNLNELAIRKSFLFDNSISLNINKSANLINNSFPMDGEPDSSEDIQKSNQKIDSIPLLISSTQTLIQALENIDPLTLDNDTRKILRQVYSKIDQVLSKKHPLRTEVLDLIARGKAGEQVFPKYDRKKHVNPLKYLEEYYGKYLKRFESSFDAISQAEIRIIDKSFGGTLVSFFSRHEEYKATDFIPTKSDFIDEELEDISYLSEEQQQRHGRVYALKATENHRKKVATKAK